MKSSDLAAIAELFEMEASKSNRPYFTLVKESWQIDFGLLNGETLYYCLLFDAERMEDYNIEVEVPLAVETADKAKARIRKLLRVADDHQLLADVLADFES